VNGVAFSQAPPPARMHEAHYTRKSASKAKPSMKSILVMSENKRAKESLNLFF
jgi:hypothetical protein